VDETPPSGLANGEIVRCLAERKVRAAAALAPRRRILAADTLVFLDDRILGKPVDVEAARTMLRSLSGRSHEVWTGVAVSAADGQGGLRVLAAATFARVGFRRISEAELEVHVARAEPLDKAGAYGIQGGAAAFVTSLGGEVDTVIGLPVALVRRLLRSLEALSPGPTQD